MFCPSCGTESTGLNYCNRCGANLAAPVELTPISLTKPILIIGAVIALLTLGGFGVVISGTIAMVQSGAGEVSPALPIFGMPTILTIDILLIRQLSKLINAALSPARHPAAKLSTQPQNTFQLPHPTTARLAPGASVTENTTRFFDEYPQPSTLERVPVKKTEG